MGQNFSGDDRDVFADFFPHFSAKTESTEILQSRYLVTRQKFQSDTLTTERKPVDAYSITCRVNSSALVIDSL
jgi:hypothetical protein